MALQWADRRIASSPRQVVTPRDEAVEERRRDDRGWGCLRLWAAVQPGCDVPDV